MRRGRRGARAGRREKLLVVMNPAAGGGTHTGEVLEAVRALRAAGHAVDVRATSAPGEARRLVADLAPTYARVAACGGDGTVSEVAAGLLDSGAAVPLVVVPSGTGNDFARAVGALPPGDAMRAALGGTIAAIDVGFAGERPFLNAVSGGAAAEISSSVTPERKASLGPLAYLASGLGRLARVRGFEARLEGDGGIHEGQMLFFAVANGQSVGGGTRIAPEARADDGLLDAVVLPAVPATSLLGALRALRAGTDHPALVRMRGERFVFEAEREVALTCDGEAMAARAIAFRVAPGALSVVVHGEAPALAHGPRAAGEKFVDTFRAF